MPIYTDTVFAPIDLDQSLERLAGGCIAKSTMRWMLFWGDHMLVLLQGFSVFWVVTVGF